MGMRVCGMGMRVCGMGLRVCEWKYWAAYVVKYGIDNQSCFLFHSLNHYGHKSHNCMTSSGKPTRIPNNFKRLTHNTINYVL